MLWLHPQLWEVKQSHFVGGADRVGSGHLLILLLLGADTRAQAMPCVVEGQEVKWRRINGESFRNDVECRLCACLSIGGDWNLRAFPFRSFLQLLSSPQHYSAMCMRRRFHDLGICRLCLEACWTSWEHPFIIHTFRLNLEIWVELCIGIVFILGWFPGITVHNSDSYWKYRHCSLYSYYSNWHCSFFVPCVIFFLFSKLLPITVRYWRPHIKC